MTDPGGALASSELLYFTERGSGPPLLLVHGLMVTGAMFEPVIERLATRHRVVVPDLRGHGRSRGLPPPYQGTGIPVGYP
jgi:pimeloyl-ACP methyl ester carboxylesterase